MKRERERHWNWWDCQLSTRNCKRRMMCMSRKSRMSLVVFVVSTLHSVQHLRKTKAQSAGKSQWWRWQWRWLITIRIVVCMVIIWGTSWSICLWEGNGRGTGLIPVERSCQINWQIELSPSPLCLLGNVSSILSAFGFYGVLLLSVRSVCDLCIVIV